MVGLALLSACSRTPAANQQSQPVHIQAEEEVTTFAESKLTIGSEGGKVTLAGAVLEVPAGAVTQKETFTLEQLSGPQIPIGLSEGVGMYLEIPEAQISYWSLTTSAESFEKPVALRVAKSDWLSGYAIYTTASNDRREPSPEWASTNKNGRPVAMWISAGRDGVRKVEVQSYPADDEIVEIYVPDGMEADLAASYHPYQGGTGYKVEHVKSLKGIPAGNIQSWSAPAVEDGFSASPCDVTDPGKPTTDCSLGETLE